MHPSTNVRAVALAGAYAVVGWAFFTVAIVALGDVLLPTISDGVAPLVVLALAAVTAVAVAVLSVDYFRRARHADAALGLVLGVCLASVGLTLDGVLLLSTRFRYPNVDGSKIGTLTVSLFVGYAVAAVVPALVGWRTGSRR
jgi:hypothetical protein